MLDITYIGLTALCFAAFFAYVRGCERLGQDATTDTETP